MVTYCVNFTVQTLTGRVSPVFESHYLRQSQHEFCEVHNHSSLGEAAAKAILIETEECNETVDYNLKRKVSNSW